MANELTEPKHLVESTEGEGVAIQKMRARVLTNNIGFNEADYTYDDHFTPWDGNDPLGVKTSADIYALLEKNKDVRIDGIILAKDMKERKLRPMRIKNRENFLAGWKAGGKRFRESSDLFSMDLELGGTSLGNETIPLLGGPFNKQLYYRDYLKMHGLAFYAYHHDPVAKFIVSTTTNFILGKGWKLVCDDPGHQALWDAFAEVNKLDQLMETASDEASIYGENMIWWLPRNASKITYQLGQGQTVPTGLLPRIRLIDPSAIWEIVTYPEDISRVLYYQWVAPTQYQTYTGKDGATGESVPTLKFIYQQVPASQVMHYKLNAVSNEKRGRSDLYPILGYMKRLRDSVNFSLTALQKQSAWAIDTTIEGNQQDVDNYTAAMEALGPVPPAGSEFAHSAKIKREYLSNSVGGGRGGGSTTFDWALDMCAIGSGIPVSYFGTSTSHGQSRAAAFVGTEPVVKKWERRQRHFRRIIEEVALRFFKEIGQEKASFEVNFPELVTQDRSTKLQDLELSQAAGWISKKRAAETAAKEFGFDDYDFDSEQKDMKDQSPAMTLKPLTTPGVDIPSEDPKPTAPGSDDRNDGSEGRGVTSADRQELDQGRGY